MFEIYNGIHTNRIKLSNFPIKLDIGCGNCTKEGYVGMDKYDFGQEILWDINLGIPVPDDSVSHIYTSHFVEHLDTHQLEILWVEMARICQNGATIEGRCPHSGNTSAYYASHHSLWDEHRITGLCRAEIGHGRFEILDMKKDENELFFNLVFRK